MTINQYISMPNASPKQSIDFRIVFSLLAMLVLVMLALVEPVTGFLDGTNTAQSSNVEEYIFSVMRMQQAHFEQHHEFAQDFRQLPIPEPPPAQKLYQYQLETFPGKHPMVAIYAMVQEPYRKKAKLRSMVGLVKAVGEKPNESTESIICKPPERGMPVVKIVESLQPLVCPGEMKESFRWPKKPR
jgi:Type IV pilin-like G and H, putative